MPEFTLKDLDKSRKQLIITAFDEELLKKKEQEVLKELSQNMKIKGFRPGKVPEKFVREQVDETTIKVQTYQKALPETANGIVADQNLRIVGEPKVEFESLDPLKVIIEFELFPEIKVGKYDKIKVKKEKKMATDQELEDAVEHFRKRLQDFKEVDRAAKKGDRVEIDFDGFDDKGEPIPNTSSQNYPLMLGDNTMIPGFEDEVMGLKKGDKKDFEITFPKDYHAEDMANKKVTFKIAVHKVEESQLPELNEELVEKITGEKKPVDEWKKDLKEQIQKEHDWQFKRELEEAFYDELIKICDIDIPDSMIEQEKQAIIGEIKQQILQRGLSYETYLQTLGKTEEEFLESQLKTASDRITLRLALDDISQKENVEASEEEVNTHLDQLLSRYPEDQRAPIKAQYKPGTQAYKALEHQVKMQKTLEKILPAV